MAKDDLVEFGAEAEKHKAECQAYGPDGNEGAMPVPVKQATREDGGEEGEEVLGRRNPSDLTAVTESTPCSNRCTYSL